MNLNIKNGLEEPLLLPEEVKIEKPYIGITKKGLNTRNKSLSSLVSICNESIEMGFPVYRIFEVMKYIPVESVQSVIDLLSKANHGWEHAFLLDEDNKDYCRICKEEYKEHLESKVEEDREDSPRLMLLPIFNEITDPEEWRTSAPCKICMNGLPLAHTFNLSCGHMHCRECVSAFLKINIINRSIIELKCPEEGCEARFKKKNIESLCDKEIYQKYSDFRLDQEISKSKEFKWCPVPDCGRFVSNSKGKSRVKCECGFEVCFKCGEAWHKGSCKKNPEELYGVWAKGRKIQRCPKCRIRIEKNEGCNHITCTNCRYQWCWICGNKYSSTHYDGIFFGCPLVQFTSSDWSYAKILIFHFLAFILSPLISIFCGFAFLAVNLCEYVSDVENCRCFLIVLFTLIIIIAGPIVGVVMMLPTMIYRFYCFAKALKRTCCG